MFHDPSRSPAYTSARPSGAKSTDRSCSGVCVIRRVVPNSTLVTKTSPRTTNATSLPFEDALNSVAPERAVCTTRVSCRPSDPSWIGTICGWPPPALR
jgi:hypothetical protein